MFGLSFLSPAFLFGALVAALPIALHLLGRRPSVRVLFPAVRLLKRTPARETRRRRLREVLLLALRVTAVFLLALAFARPYVPQPAAASSRSVVVVALDRSFSMSAPGQFGRALSLAEGAVNAAAPGTLVGLLTFDDDAHVLVKPTADRTEVLRALAGVRPGYAATSYATALARAAEALGSASGRIVVVTDLQRTGWERRDAPISAGIDIVVQDAGSPESNLAVSDLRRIDNGMSAIVRNSGPGARKGQARLIVGGRVRGTMPFAVDPSGTQEILFSGPLPASGEAAVEIDDAIGYQADNKAYVLLDPPEPAALLAMTGQSDPSRGSFYLQRALEVDNARLFHLESESASYFSARASARTLDRYAAVFLLGTRGLSPAAVKSLGEYVAGGGGMLVALDDQVEPATLNRVLTTQVSMSFQSVERSTSAGMLPADVRHPILQDIGADAFDSARFERVTRTSLDRDAVLARFGDGTPALIEQRHGAGRVLLFGSDLSNRWNDLPLQPAFLPLIHQVARYLGHDRMPVRDFVVSAVPPGVPYEPGVVTLPATASAPSGLPSGQKLRSPRRIVVNVDPRESDVSRLTPRQFQQSIARTNGGKAKRGEGTPASEEVGGVHGTLPSEQALWRLAIALAIIALLAEGSMGRTVNT